MNIGAQQYGLYTDKNGFYYAQHIDSGSENADIEFTVKLNCSYPFGFAITSSLNGSGWAQNGNTYLSNENAGIVGFGNYVLYKMWLSVNRRKQVLFKLWH